MERVIQVNGKGYEVLDLLGKGKGGYSYLTCAPETGELFVVKQLHHEPCDYYQFGDKLSAELRDYQRLKELDVPMPLLCEVDEAGERLRKEYIEGESAYRLVLDDRMTPELVEQIGALARRLAGAGLNIDYFPTNFILRGGTLWYVDYECNEYMEQWSFERWGAKYWAKTPEFLSHAAEHG